MLRIRACAGKDTVKRVKKSDKFFKEFYDKLKEELSFITLKTSAKIKLGRNEYTADRE